MQWMAPFLGPVRSMDGCWIGVDARILPGVTIGRHAVVGANAVVSHDVPDGAVAGGMPTRLIKQGIHNSPDLPWPKQH
jgi:acetyltransferase-like isoleucine patch superfamily enzyme